MFGTTGGDARGIGPARAGWESRARCFVRIRRGCHRERDGGEGGRHRRHPRRVTRGMG